MEPTEMLPSRLAREVQNGRKQFLRTGFAPSDTLFDGVMQCFTEDEMLCMKGSHIQVGPSFHPGNHGWEVLYKDDKWRVPDGTVVTMEVADDKYPGSGRVQLRLESGGVNESKSTRQEVTCL
jgi:hypothetical protein